MTARGRVSGYVRDPDGLHQMLNLTHEPVVDRYLQDPAEAMADPATQHAGEEVQARYRVPAAVLRRAAGVAAGRWTTCHFRHTAYGDSGLPAGWAPP